MLNFRRATLVFLCLCATGCGAAARDLTRQAVPGAVEGGIDAMVDPQNQERVIDGLREENVERAVDKVVSGVVDGSLESMTVPERREAMRDAFVELTRGFQLPMRIDAIDRNTMGDIVDESLERVLTVENGDKVRAMVRVLLLELVSAAMDVSEKAELGKHMQEGVRLIAKNAALGFQDAVDETAAQKRNGALPEDRGNLLMAADEAAKGGTSVMWLVAAGVSGFAIALLAAILWSGRRSRASRAALEDRDAALMALTAVLGQAQSKPWAGELRELLKESIYEKDCGSELRRILKAQQQATPVATAPVAGKARSTSFEYEPAPPSAPPTTRRQGPASRDADLS